MYTIVMEGITNIDYLKSPNNDVNYLKPDIPLGDAAKEFMLSTPREENEKELIPTIPTVSTATDLLHSIPSMHTSEAITESPQMSETSTRIGNILGDLIQDNFSENVQKDIVAGNHLYNEVQQEQSSNQLDGPAHNWISSKPFGRTATELISAAQSTFDSQNETSIASYIGSSIDRVSSESLLTDAAKDLISDIPTTDLKMISPKPLGQTATDLTSSSPLMEENVKHAISSPPFRDEPQKTQSSDCLPEENIYNPQYGDEVQSLTCDTPPDLLDVTQMPSPNSIMQMTDSQIRALYKDRRHTPNNDTSKTRARNKSSVSYPQDDIMPPPYEPNYKSRDWSSEEIGDVSKTTASTFSSIPRKGKLCLLVIVIANFGAGCNYSLPAPFFPKEAILKGATETIIGLIFSCYQLIQLIAYLCFGNFVAKIGARFMFFSGILVGGSCSALFGFLCYCPAGHSFIVLSFLIRIVEATGMAMFGIASFAIVSNEFPNYVASVFAAVETAIGFGLMIGPTIGGCLYQVGGFGMPFWVIGLMIIACGVFAIFCMPSDIGTNQKKDEGSMLTLLRSPLVWVSLMLVMAGTCAMNFIEPVLALHLEKFNLSTLETSLFFLIIPVLQAIQSPFVGYLSDVKGFAVPLMFASCVTSALGFLMLGPTPLEPSLPKKLWLVALGLVTFGSMVACTLIAPMNCIVRGARDLGLPDSIATFGLVSGLYATIFYFGGFVGPTIGGYLTERIGFPYSTTIIAGTFAFCFIVLSIFFCCRRAIKRKGNYSLYTSLKDVRLEDSKLLSQLSISNSFSRQRPSAAGLGVIKSPLTSSVKSERSSLLEKTVEVTTCYETHITGDVVEIGPRLYTYCSADMRRNDLTTTGV